MQDSDHPDGRFFFEEWGPEHTFIRFELTEILLRKESEYQKIDIARSPDYGKMLILDGNLMFTETDEAHYHEMAAHVPVLLHPKPGKVLVIGGGDGGVVRELLKHNEISSIVLVEIDPEVTRLCREYFPELTTGLDDSKVEIRHEDGVKYIEGSDDGTYDIVIVDSTDPVGPAKDLFNESFYENCKRIVSSGGILNMQSASPYIYPEVLQKNYGIFKKLFMDVLPYRVSMPAYPAGQICFLLGSKELIDESSLREKKVRDFFSLNGVNLKYLTASHLKSVFLPTADIIRTVL